MRTTKVSRQRVNNKLVHLGEHIYNIYNMVFVFYLRLVAGLSEVCVCSADEAYALYEICRETLKANTGSIYSRCVKEALTLNSK